MDDRRPDVSTQPAPQRRPSDSREAPRGPRLPTPSPPRFRLRWWLIWIIGLLVVNYFLASRATRPPERVRVPYSPFFLQQVDAGHVASITSKGSTVQGTFTIPESYANSKPTERFQTEIPSFADTNALSRLLQRKGVVVNAVSLDTSAPWWENLLFGFGPTLLF